MENKLKGIMVYYINVGNLSNKKSDKAIKDYVRQIEPIAKRTKEQGYEWILIPVKDADCHIELLSLK
jgi:hypothetical protein